jgi:hypothetical protein
MVIKNQNAVYFLMCGSWWRQTRRLLDDENFPRTDAGLSGRRRKAKRVRIRTWVWSNEARQGRYRSRAGVISFHALTLRQAVLPLPSRKRVIFASHSGSPILSPIRETRSSYIRHASRNFSEKLGRSSDVRGRMQYAVAQDTST